MDLPPGFDPESKFGKVCKLKKSLYGLKQSSRVQFERFTRAVKGRAYTYSSAYHTLSFKHFSGGNVAILDVYVADIILTGEDVSEIETLKVFFNPKVIEIKDLRKLI